MEDAWFCHFVHIRDSTTKSKNKFFLKCWDSLARESMKRTSHSFGGVVARLLIVCLLFFCRQLLVRPLQFDWHNNDGVYVCMSFGFVSHRHKWFTNGTVIVYVAFTSKSFFCVFQWDNEYYAHINWERIKEFIIERNLYSYSSLASI